MMRTEEIKIYSFDELSPKAKEVARSWWREGHESDSERVIDDAADIAELFGLDIRQRRVTLMDGTPRYTPSVYFTGFYSQGDGACFDGQYKYRKSAVQSVRELAPNDTELLGIVQRLQRVQSRNFYQLTARTQHAGRYYHSGSMHFDIERADGLSVLRESEEEVIECLRDFAGWIYARLRDQYEFEMADEQVDEALVINEYEFTEDGQIY